MTLEEVMQAQGLTPEQIAAVEKGMQENGLQMMTPEQAKQLAEYETLLPEHTKLQADYDAVVKNADTLKQTADKASGELNKLHIDVQVKDALRAARVKDMEYAIFKLAQSGELNLDKDGKVTDLDARVKALVESIPDNFTKEEKKEVEVRKPAAFNASAATEPQSLAEALQDAYANKDKE